MLSGAAAGSGMERPRERRLKEEMGELLLTSSLFNSKLKTQTSKLLFAASSLL